MQKIVVWDPKGVFVEGTVVEHEKGVVIETEGVIVLPIEESMLMLSGAGGFAKRSWGPGRSLSAMVPQLTCPLTLYCKPEHRVLNWAFRLVIDGDHKALADKTLHGVITVAPGPARATGYHATITPSRPPLQGNELGLPDKLGGWTVRGQCLFHPPAESYYEVALYGALAGARVAWFAASATSS